MTGRAASDRDLPEDVLRAIAQHAAGEGDRRVLEVLGKELAGILAQRVLARPEFAADLRARLLAEATSVLPAARSRVRRVSGEAVIPLERPEAPKPQTAGRRWWRAVAPPVAVAGLAAAAVVVALLAGRGGGRVDPRQPPVQVAMQNPSPPPMDRSGPERSAGSQPSPAVMTAPRDEEPGDRPGSDWTGPRGGTSIASYQPEGTALNLPLPASFQPVDAGAKVPPGVQAQASLLQIRLQLQKREVPDTRPLVYRLVPASWEPSLVREVVRRLGLGPLGAGAPGEQRAASPDSTRTLRLTAAGELIYDERAHPPATGSQVVDEDGARQVAQSVLARAGLPAPAGEPAVRTASYVDQGVPGAFWVEWTSRTPGGYPLLGGPDRAVVAPWGQVVHVRLQRVRAEPLGVVPLKPVEEAAQELNGLPVQGSGEVTLEGVELVYGRPERPEAGEDLVAQPYYRYTGHTAEGWPYTGYVAATAGAPGPARAAGGAGNAGERISSAGGPIGR